MMNKPFSQSCENNKQPILAIIERIFVDDITVWEIGSGTGQHACFFAKNLPHLQWQTTDRSENLPGIKSWLESVNLKSLPASLALDVKQSKWPCKQIDALFSANTLHIMHWSEVEAFFVGMEKYLTDSASICIYGPFNYQGKYTSSSNQNFDQWLKSRDPESGIRDFEAVTELAKQAGLVLINDFEMPANNRLLHFKKVNE